MTYLAHVGRKLGLTSLTLGAAAGLVSVGALATMRRPLPRIDGTLPLPGLQERVEVVRDRWGVPHIYAANNTDLFMALGYVHAQDRLWQMELNRRTGHGHLAEIFGEPAISSDRFVRVLGLGRVARRHVEQLDADTRTIVEAYVSGINAFLETHSNRLPIEFTLLRYQPQPWEAADVVVWSKVIAYGLSVNWTVELFHARLFAALGEERARELLMHYLPNQPLTVPLDVFRRHGIGEELFHAAAPPRNGNKHGIGHIPGEGSNAWAISGKRSSTGKPLLANDPHLSASLPCIWYEVHLAGGDYAVTGASFPGLPGVVIGHNAHIAWGITNALVDVQDLYVERFHPSDPLLYAWQDGWERAELVREEIRVKGRAEPVIEDVLITRHGPVISPVLAPQESPLSTEHHEQNEAQAAPPGTPTEALALRWTGLDSTQSIQSALAVNRARNWQEFRAALATWDTPPENFVYADSAGHYGYLLAGKVPIRAQGEGRLPLPGWTGAHEWISTIPPEALPASFDPSDGIIISANNQITDASYAYHQALHGEWLSGYRAVRIRELLEAAPSHDVHSFAHIQLDQRSLPGLHLAHLLADVPLSDPLECQARDVLVAWDGEVHPDSVGATIYASFRYHLERQAYAPIADLRSARAGSGLFQVLPGSEMLNRRSLPGILARIAAAPSPDRVDPWLGTERTWNTVLQECMQFAVAELRQALGNNPQHWRYGRLHTLTLRHVMSNVSMLAPVFNRGPWPTGGDADTICQGYTPRDTASRPIYVAPQYRQICDPSDWDASLSVILGGQSGHPGSRYYCDMAALWVRGEYHPMLWSRTKVEQHAVGTLMLRPE